MDWLRRSLLALGGMALVAAAAAAVWVPARTDAETRKETETAPEAVPEVAETSPSRMRRLVVLPAPFGPRKP